MISACMIVQDEEVCVSRALDSIHDYVDEVIIVDGGSADRTRDIVLQYSKVRLFDIPFQMDFALQYNNAIERATGEWILMIDADEYYPKYTCENLIILTLVEPEADAFSFPTKTFVDGKLLNPHYPDPHIRYFRNYCRYAGKFHSSLIGFKKLIPSNLDLFHDKTAQQQWDSNFLYWDMGQAPQPGWQKIDGKWVNTNI